jgi:hypothetical protein
MFAGLRKAVAAKKQGGTVRLKFAPKSENKTYNHFTPIKGTSQRALSKELARKTKPLNHK